MFDFFLKEGDVLSTRKKFVSVNINGDEKGIYLLEEHFSNINPNIEIIKIPLPSETQIDNKPLVASYINFYFCKNSLLIPKFNVEEDLHSE